MSVLYTTREAKLHAIFQLNISQNTKCADITGFADLHGHSYYPLISCNTFIIAIYV